MAPWQISGNDLMNPIPTGPFTIDLGHCLNSNHNPILLRLSCEQKVQQRRRWTCYIWDPGRVIDQLCQVKRRWPQRRRTLQPVLRKTETFCFGRIAQLTKTAGHRPNYSRRRPKSRFHFELRYH
ncbi:hypothetical protein evm_004247 [Chilo suppressalis]|nr:hypothetical protein evm_004247 [Chilo suppressalis]